FPALRLAQVDGHAAFVSIHTQKVGAFSFNERRSPLASVVPGSRAFDFHHVRAPVAQHHGAVRAAENAGKIKDAHALERTPRWFVGHLDTSSNDVHRLKLDIL